MCNCKITTLSRVVETKTGENAVMALIFSADKAFSARATGTMGTIATFIATPATLSAGTCMQFSVNIQSVFKKN